MKTEMGWACSCTEHESDDTGWWLGNLRKTDSLGDRSISRIIILKIILKRKVGSYGLGLPVSAGFCECDNVSSSFIKFGKFLD
jgi:hypothetical protein